MRKRILLILAILTVFTSASTAQIERAERARQRIEQLRRAEDDRNRQRREELDRLSAIPKPRAAVMNVNVQTVLTKSEYKTFAEAKPNAVTRVSDGDELWFYAKFNSRLGDYVLTVEDAEDPTSRRYLLYVEIGPKDDVTTLNQYVLEFKKEDLAAQELKINLAPGLQGRNKSIPVFLMMTSAGKPGLWQNEIRLTNTITFPRSLTDNLAKSTVTLDLAGGPDKYRAMEDAYDSIALRGTTDVSRMPAPGSFYDEGLKGQIVAKLSSVGIIPARLYFSGDNWMEYASFSPAIRKSRKVFATFTYRKAETCFYGVATTVQDFEAMKSAFGESVITLQKDTPLPCAQLN
jgi:hypothetical protein